MKVTALEVENVKRIKAIKIEPGEDLNLITGPNEAGKSSVLDSIMMAMGGKNALADVPLRKGEKKGKVTVDLGKYRVTRSFTAGGGGTLKVESSDGAYYKSPQTLLDSWKNDFAFDPLAFAEGDQSTQKEMLLKLVKIRPNLEILARITGNEPSTIKVDPDDPLTSLARLYDDLYLSRRDVGRELQAQKGRISAISIPEDQEDTVAVEITALIKQRTAMTAIEQENATARHALQEITGEIRVHKMNVESAQKRISRLRKALEAAKAALAKATEEWERKELALSKITEQAAQQTEIVKALVDPDYTEIDARLGEAEKTNKIAALVETRKAEEDTLEEIKTRFEGLTKKLKGLRDYREDLLSTADFPMTGLSMDDQGHVTFDDVPVSQRGKSQRIIIGLNICAALHPTLQVVLIHEGNDLDDDNLEAVHDWAQARGFQVWMERIQPGKQKGVSFEIIDGGVKK